MANVRPASRSSARQKARKRALDILFESELREADPLETLTERTADADPPVREFTATLVQGVSAHRDQIDARITSALKSHWTLARMPRVDRNLARIAVYELDYTDLPRSVAVSEAVTLAGELSTDDSPSFLNGVLKKIASA